MARLRDRLNKVAIVDNSIDPDVYKPVEHWRTWLGAPWESFRAPDGRLPSLAGGYSHVILTGSEASIVEREPWVDLEIHFVREALDNNIPIFGSCYGHQLLALALRGPAHVRRCPRPEIGWLPITIAEENPIFGNRKRKAAFAFSSHFDEVIGLDDNFRILASSAGCLIQAFQLKNRPVWGIQFHPEIGIAAAGEFLASLVRLGHPSKALFEEALRQSPRDSGLIRPIIRNFLASGSRIRL
jgi:GMP synthase-like glutamine amidotransferase